MSTVTFSMNGLSNAVLHKKLSLSDHFVENTARSTMAPKLMISLQTKAACYSPIYSKRAYGNLRNETKRNETVICEVDQRSNQNTGKMYKSYKNF